MSQDAVYYALVAVFAVWGIAWSFADLAAGEVKP